MRLKDVPVSPAYLVAHDCFDNGAMEVWPCDSWETARDAAFKRQEHADNMGEDAVIWRAYIKLPRRKVFKFYPDAKVL